MALSFGDVLLSELIIVFGSVGGVDRRQIYVKGSQMLAFALGIEALGEGLILAEAIGEHGKALGVRVFVIFAGDC